ncbi:PQQ-binding-like beta-propeller repeat protein [Flavivirga sp. 57AJ16]|uniref:outer membrane protein assembly factor BamB family protein n=1 Tax=Flavivirga sp. 57AJ16 TaxID=3025307 RepID=UPI002366F079|nr:PQQ-binding-like beta-propeller repeat protein [Flavivirga sp. 57AJ16]MDD7886269.1 PQQ-binding-like beta-propeller repeat protein [Flavivirga sp. 57AJ16]
MKEILKKIVLTMVVALAIFGCENDSVPPIEAKRLVVENIEFQVAHEKVQLSWDKPSKGTPIGYRIYVADVLVADLDGSITSYEITGLEVNTEHKIWIESIISEDEKSLKVPVSVFLPDELNLQVYPGNEFVIARWEKPNRSDISGYYLSWTPGGETGVLLDENIAIYQITELQNFEEYTVTLSVVYDGIASPVEVVSQVIPGPVEPFTTSEVTMSGQTIDFTYNPAFLSTNTAVTWAWDFGDGNASEMENPEHTYDTPGIYNVKMTVTDDAGLVYVTETDLYVWGVKWTFAIGAEVRPQAPALADDGTIYICARSDNKFYAINPDGTLKWEYTEFTDYSYASASIGTDGTIYVASRDDNLHAINPDGTQKWISSVDNNVNYSTPAIADDGTLYLGSDEDNLYAINPDGSRKWVFETTNNVKSSPAIGSDGTIFFASDDDNFYALNPDGTEKWSANIGGNSQLCPAIDTDGTVIVAVGQGGTDGSVYAFNPDDGSIKWHLPTFGRIEVSSPVIANGTVYVGTKDTNNLLAIDASSGNLLWTFTVGGIIDCSPAVDKNGTIYFGSADNYFYAVNPDGTLKYKYLTGNRIWSGVSIGDDGTVYIGAYDGNLYAFEMFAEGLAEDAWPMRGKNNKHTSNVKD